MARLPSFRSSVAVLAVLALGAAAPACASAGQSYLGMISGPINDPSNRTLRRSILAFGLKEFCNEMTHKSAPVTLSPGAPLSGRFYPSQCVQKETPEGDLYVEFSGRGYAFTNVTKKMTFTAGGAVRYDQDFLMDGSTMYAYFRTKSVDQSSFQTIVIEQPAASVLNGMLSIGNTVGRELVNGKLREGFTVIREADGRADFGLGLVPKGSRPPHAIETGEDRTTVESLVAEVHQGQRDFVGPIRVDAKGRALTIRVKLDGAPAADVLLVNEAVGQQTLGAYLSTVSAGPLAGPPLAYDTVRLGQDYVRTVPVPPGLYYVVLDNTLRAGAAAPPMISFDDRAATFRYAIEIGGEP